MSLAVLGTSKDCCSRKFIPCLRVREQGVADPLSNRSNSEPIGTLKHFPSLTSLSPLFTIPLQSWTELESEAWAVGASEEDDSAPHLTFFLALYFSKFISSKKRYCSNLEFNTDSIDKKCFQ